jgi:hypothetical protein
MAVPVRPQAEAIARPSATAVALVVLVLAGCGGDQDSGGTTQERSGASDTQTPEPAPDLAAKSKPSRRDVEVERDLKRNLKQEAGLASGWTFADIRAAQVRGRQVVIETRLKPGEREPASSLCLAVRRHFQEQDPSSVIVSGRDRSALVEC